MASSARGSYSTSSWGMGAVLRQAGGSTGQSASSAKWTRLSRTISESYQQDSSRRGDAATATGKKV